MRPLIVALAIVAATPAAAHAQTAEPDPMAALRALLARGAGATTEFYGNVATTLARTTRLDTGQWITHRAAMNLSGTGRVKLGGSGVAASEETKKMKIGTRFMMEEAAPEDAYFAGVLRAEGPMRTVSVGGWHYQLAPKTKAWLRTGRASGAAALIGDQFVNVLEPATLRKLLSGKHRKSVSSWTKDRTTGRKHRIYSLSGDITFAELARVSPSLREAAGTAAVGSSVVTWTYMYDDRGWPYRVGWRFYAHPHPEVKGFGHDRIFRAYYATQFRDWEKPMTVTAPKAKTGRGLPVDDLGDVLGAGPRP
ncbi:hypothetical protein [Herbidospora mongoliensis]|uniref:hypothetical protein n=1 Tax=Herbidospora mongoliensis TaxID=688067 RepID=UPI0008372944|nr:hypothetical protein [Herbidospora mongoliensis]